MEILKFFFSFKLRIIILLTLVTVLVLSTPAKAECGPRLEDPNCDFGALWNSSLQDGNNGFATTAAFMSAAIGQLTTITGGPGWYQPLTPAAPVTPGTEGTELPYNLNNHGLIGAIGKGVNAVYENKDSISGIQYLASLNPFKPAYAAGADLLNPVLELWKIFRNIAYMLIVLVLIAFGFLVMFRYKIDPRTVISVSDALPRVAIALVLITFSYPLAGLMIDGMKVMEQMTASTLSPIQKSFVRNNIVHIPKDAANAVDPSGNSIEAPGFPQEFSYGRVIQSFFGSFGNISIPCLNLQATNTASGTVQRTGSCSSSLVDASAQLVFNFMVISIAVGLLFSLLRYFATFFILTIFGPLVFLWSVLPGQEETARKWFLQMITAALVFPAVYLFLNIAFFFDVYSVSGSNYNNAEILLRPGDPWEATTPRLIQGSTNTTIMQLIKVGILLITSKLPEAIEEALKSSPSRSMSGVSDPIRNAARRVPFVGGMLG